MRKIKLAIVSTHPIQYYAPVFRALAAGSQVSPRVFYTWSQAAEGAVFDPGFGADIQWDVPLLDGYEHQFVPNVAKRPGTHHFLGVRNPGLIGAIETWGADAVLVFGWNLWSHLRTLRYFKGRIPVLFRGDSTLLDDSPPLRRLIRKCVLRSVYRYVDTAICVGQNSRDYFRWCGLSESQIVFAPHSVEIERFSQRDAEHESWARRRREELGISTNDTVILFAAKFIPKKDPMLLLNAFRDANTNAHLVFVGNGSEEESLRALAACAPNIHFAPFQNQSVMPGVYRIGDVFVLPSRGPGETWGLALNEAMACARPVIAASRVGGARDLVIEAETGWVFESGNRGQLANLITLVASMPRDGLRAIGRRAQSHISTWSSADAAAGIEAAVRAARSSQHRHPKVRS